MQASWLGNPRPVHYSPRVWFRCRENGVVPHHAWTTGVVNEGTYVTRVLVRTTRAVVTEETYVTRVLVRTTRVLDEETCYMGTDNNHIFCRSWDTRVTRALVRTTRVDEETYVTRVLVRTTRVVDEETYATRVLLNHSQKQRYAAPVSLLGMIIGPASSKHMMPTQTPTLAAQLALISWHTLPGNLLLTGASTTPPLDL
jgi:hypothetical protein